MNEQSMQIQGINIEQFERTLYENDGSVEAIEEGAQVILHAISNIRNGGGFVAPTDAEITVLYTRMAAAITAFLSNPKTSFSPDGFYRMMSEHAILHAIFRGSAFGTMDHILAVVGSREAAHLENVSFNGTTAVQKLLLCWSLDSGIEIGWDAIAGMNKEMAAGAIIGILGVGGTHTRKGYERRLALMKRTDIMDAAPLSEFLIQSAGDCYMHCSYTDAQDKHQIKRMINRKLREVVERSVRVEEAPAKVTPKVQPTVVIPLEWFGSFHAMYRCYANSLMQLRPAFKLVAVIRHGGVHPSIDDEAKKVFDDVIEIPEEHASIDTFLKAIQDQNPDIVYYPSLGMAAWFVALSTFRLAPIQIVTPGHPATTMSDKIDYMISDGDLFGNVNRYSEKLIPLPTGATRYLGRAGFVAPDPTKRKRYRVAIPAMSSKLIPPFLETLQEIAKQVAPVEYHFFPNMTGLSHTVIQKDLREWFPDCVVHHRTTYQAYMENLNECGMMLSTFPFGGTNSTIDAFLLKLPVICLEGDEIHQRSDASMIRRMGLPAWWIAKTKEEYVEAALDVLVGRGNPDWRDADKEFFSPVDPEQRPDLHNAFLKAFQRIYKENT